MLVKKTFTADDFEEPNNTAANLTVTNAANDNLFDEKSWFLKTFINCVLKTNRVEIDNADYLDAVMSM